MQYACHVRGVGLLLVLIVASLSRFSFAHTWVFSDYDDTFVETRQIYGGTFSTPFRLFRISSRTSPLQGVPSGDESILVTPQEYERMIPYLAPSSDQPGTAIGREHKLADGRKVKPSEYYIRNPQTFRYFLESPEGKNYILRDFKRAENFDSEGKYWGPFYPIAREILSREETAEFFGLLTARGHSKAEWDGFFTHLQSQKYISHKPNLDLIHALSDPKYDFLGPTLTGGKRKLPFLKEFVNHLARTILTENDLRLHPDGDRIEKLHYVLIAEDKPEFLEPMVRHAQAIAREGKIPVKFAFFNAGTKTNILDSARPQFSVVKSDGSFRPGTFAELYAEPKEFREAYRQKFDEVRIPTPFLLHEEDRSRVLSHKNLILPKSQQNSDGVSEEINAVVDQPKPKNLEHGGDACAKEVFKNE